MGNSPSSVPLNSQNNTVHLTLSCRDGSEVLPINTTFSVTTPLIAGSFYFNNITASLQLPESIIGGILNVSIDATNANPLSVSVQRATYGSHTSLNLPGENSQLQPYGPLSLGPVNLTGLTSTFSLGPVSYTVLNSDSTAYFYVSRLQIRDMR